MYEPFYYLGYEDGSFFFGPDNKPWYYPQDGYLSAAICAEAYTQQNPGREIKVCIWQPPEIPGPPEPYQMPYYCQREGIWAGDLLGFSSTTTIADWGCLLCDVAMLVSLLLEQDINPREMNDLLKSHDGGFVNADFEYNKGNLLRFGAIWEMFPDKIKAAGYFDFPYPKPATPEVMDPVLNRGGGALIKVDFDPATSKVDQHWVLAVGVDSPGSVYSIIDPWDGKAHLLPPSYGRGGWTAANIIFRISQFERKE